jgi:hypothetical protein
VAGLAVGQAGAFVHHGAAMNDQLLDGAGLGVFGRPGFEFIVVSPEQLGQVASVLGVVFGAAGDESLAELLEAERIDGVEADPLVSFEEGDEVDGGLFQAQSHAGLGVLLAQFQEPLPEGLGGGVDSSRPMLAGAGVNEVQIGLAIGAIQADDQVIRVRCVHIGCVGYLDSPQA